MRQFWRYVVLSSVKLMVASVKITEMTPIYQQHRLTSLLYNWWREKETILSLSHHVPICCELGRERKKNVCWDWKQVNFDDKIVDIYFISADGWHLCRFEFNVIRIWFWMFILNTDTASFQRQSHNYLKSNHEIELFIFIHIKWRRYKILW